jgi:ribosomal-protein-alanine N-acetyltransferase
VVDLAVTGPSLRVRIPRSSDAGALYAQAADPEVTRWFSWGPYRSEAEACAYLARLPAQRGRGEQLDLVVEHLEAGPIGITGLAELSARDRRATIGTWLGREWWGTGANRECKALMCHVAFELCGLQRVGAYANVEHARSQRALERVGFQREGLLRAFHRHDGQPLDVAVFSLLRDEWLAGPLRDVPLAVAGVPPHTFVVAP